MDKFIRRQNVAHYRSLLTDQRLDAVQRRTILTLLAEEERHGLPPADEASGGDGHE